MKHSNPVLSGKSLKLMCWFRSYSSFRRKQSRTNSMVGAALLMDPGGDSEAALCSRECILAFMFIGLLFEIWLLGNSEIFISPRLSVRSTMKSFRARGGVVPFSHPYPHTRQRGGGVSIIRPHSPPPTISPVLPPLLRLSNALTG